MHDKDPLHKYHFLHTHIAKEAHIYEVLDEIYSFQEEALRGNGNFATLEDLKNSRKIKIPFSPTRNKSISYLVDLLSKTYPDDIMCLLTFSFNVSQGKKLVIDEIKEYTIMLDNNSFGKLQDDRDEKSLASLLSLLKQFRLFNLTKLVSKSPNKSHITRIIKKELGKKIFAFKKYSADKNNYEVTEEYAFHHDNYEPVKQAMKIDGIKKIISANAAQINRRLNKFGILNTDFNDYRDRKLDYLLNILLEDIPTNLTDKDLAEVKNFASLRNCLLKVDSVIDPLVTLENDIINYIRDNKVCREGDITAVFVQIDRARLKSWLAENSDKHKIIPFTNEKNESFIIDGTAFLKLITDLSNIIIADPYKFSALPADEKQEKQSLFHMYCNAGKHLLQSRELSLAILSNDENIDRVDEIVSAYEDYQKKIVTKHSRDKERLSDTKKKSLFGIIIEFISSLFGSKKNQESIFKEAKPGNLTRRSFSKETRNLYEEIKSKQGLILALSDYLELNHENDYKIDVIINELRDNNLKIIIPIYNARNVLFPIRSQKYIIPDMEYLLVDPEVINSPEAIRAYTDSLAGFKLKNEAMPSSAIMSIEKYLLTIYRQKKAQMKRRK